MTEDALTSQPAWKLAQTIRERLVSSREVVETHLRRIDEVNPRLHAVIQLRGDAAMREATAADDAIARGDDVGPLHGVPFTVKDWIETNDLPCAAGIEQRRDYVPKHDATAVARLRAAGAILLGKTKPGTENDLYPRANNPHDVTRTPGGSSAGEAAIIAAHGSPLGLGSDSGGSLRWPAHCCGIVALKPTNGLVPLTGHFPRISPLADSRTVIGPLARDVDDLTLALGIVAGADGRDASCAPVQVGDSATVGLSGLRVATYTAMPGASPTAAVIAATRAAAARLAGAGAIVEERTPPRLEEALPITIAYWRRPESTSMAEWRPDKASALSADEVERSLFEWDRFRRTMLAFMEDFDVIVCPVAEDAAPLHETPITGQTYIYLLPYSLTGYPVVSVPAGVADDGLPLGVQVIAKPWHDHVALSAARAAKAPER